MQHKCHAGLPWVFALTYGILASFVWCKAGGFYILALFTFPASILFMILATALHSQFCSLVLYVVGGSLWYFAVGLFVRSVLNHDSAYHSKHKQIVCPVCGAAQEIAIDATGGMAICVRCSSEIDESAIPGQPAGSRDGVPAAHDPELRHYTFGDRKMKRRLTILISAFLILVLMIPLILELGTHGTTDVSSSNPYNQFKGEYVISKMNGSIWMRTDISGETDIRKNHVLLDSLFGEGEPEVSSGLKKVAVFSTGTRFKIESIKRKRVGRYLKAQVVTVLCTVYLNDGRKMKCEMPWDCLDPDPHRWSTQRFERVSRLLSPSSPDAF